MSAPQWKPGDVAAVGSQRVFRHAGQFEWTNDVGSRFNGTVGLDARPLVVIDPEDREQVERLFVSYVKRQRPTDGSGGVEWMQAALRSLVTDPKPPEPQGLGAVVEDAEGERYVRYATHSIAPWRAEDPDEENRPYRYYKDLTAVRVLSEGWSE